MSSAAWYWHRLRAMSAAELAGHGRRKLHQVSDRLFSARRFAVPPEVGQGSTFPQLPPRDTAPESLRQALRQDAAQILNGRWIAFGHLELQLDDPPRWHKDYLAGADLATDKPALKLHHRLEGKADIKLIWEPSRWYSLVRLAQAAYVLGDEQAGSACVRWLADWSEKNPPYFGWNWTSGLESGIRLIQLAWIDALLEGCKGGAAANSSVATGPGKFPSSAGSNAGATLAGLRGRLLPPHLWFTWRDRSFGSSANNHLLGELAGLILSVVRWPNVASWAAPIDTLQRLWEREVLTQFAPDGGNREQALNYHLFGWEFCWQARLALKAARRAISPAVEDRLRAASAFFTAVQVEQNAWDYGDSDSAFVTPLFANWSNATAEWYRWLDQPPEDSSIRYWLGDPPKPLNPAIVSGGPEAWRVYPETGLALFKSGNWFLRWDLSPLGYLATAGHGHCDALQLSLWYRGQPVFIDPGTAAYHANRPLRDYLASWAAHNGPRLVPSPFPERRGAFLWSSHHEKPTWERVSDTSLSGELRLPNGVVRRTISRLGSQDGWQIDDAFEAADPRHNQEAEVFWQFAPGARLLQSGRTLLQIGLDQGTLVAELDSAWTTIELGPLAGTASKLTTAPDLRGRCSSAFRRVETAPYLVLRAAASKKATFRTTVRADRSQ